MKTLGCWSALLGVIFFCPELFGQFSYLASNGSITITAYSGDGGAVEIPSSITFVSGYDVDDNPIYTTWPVTSIGNTAFWYSSVTSVTIPDTVTNIGGAIDEGAFFECNNLASVTIGSNVATIGPEAFAFCYSLTNLNIPHSVVSIGDNAFYNCTDLTSVSIPDSVTSLGNQVFIYCTSLTNATIPSSITSFGYDTFFGCTNLISVTFEDGITSIGEDTFNECIGLTSITIPNGVTNIEMGEFSGCASLTNVILPNSIASIDRYAFEDCANLQNILFTSNAPDIDPLAFQLDNPPPTLYYLSNTLGWSNNLAGCTTVLWNPSIQTTNSTFGVQSNQFGFTIIGNQNIPILVEATTNLSSPVWTPIQTLTLTNGTVYFSDPQWINYSSRFYGFGFP